MVFPVPVPDAEAVQRTAGSGGLRGAAGSGGAGFDPGAVYRPQPDGESHAAKRGPGVRAAGRHRLGRADRRGGKIHAEGSAGGSGGLLRAHRLDAVVERGNGGHRLLPQGELRELPYKRRPGHGGGTGPGQDLDPPSACPSKSTSLSAPGIPLRVSRSALWAKRPAIPISSDSALSSATRFGTSSRASASVSAP